MKEASQFEENAVCEVCGRFGAFNFGGQHLCADCYEGRGSCCPEFGADDLWEFEECPRPGDKPKAEQPAPRHD